MGTSRTYAAVLAAVMVMSALSALFTPGGSGSRHGFAAGNCDADPTLQSRELTLLDLLNGYRQANGLAAFVVSQSLSRSAQWKAQNMGDLNYFVHDDTPIGRSWSTRIADCGYPSTSAVGENIAAGQQSARDAFEAWLGSPGHKANILNGGFQAIGIGSAYVAGSAFGWYWVTDFGGTGEQTSVAAPPPSTPTPTAAAPAAPAAAPKATAAAPAPTRAAPATNEAAAPTETTVPVFTATPETARAYPAEFVPPPRPRVRLNRRFHMVKIAGAARD